MLRFSVGVFIGGVVTGVALSIFISAVLKEGPCATDPHLIGDMVRHKVTGKQAAVVSSFCSGSGPSRGRAYRVSDGGKDLIYWKIGEIED